MPSPTRPHPTDVLVTIAALQDQLDDLTAVVQAQQARIDILITAVADRASTGRP